MKGLFWNTTVSFHAGALHIVILFILMSIGTVVRSDATNPDTCSMNEESIGALKNRLIVSPNDWKICNTIGFYYYRHKRYDLAIDYYTKAIQRRPEYAVAHNNIGAAYLKTNKFSLAKRHFAKAVSLNPTYVKALCNLAVAYFRMGEFQEARALYLRAKDLDPDYLNQRVTRFRNRTK